MTTSLPAWTTSPPAQLTAATLATLSPSLYFFSRIAGDPLSRGDIKVLIRTYVLTGVIGIPTAMVLQSLLAYPMAFMCFGSNKAAVHCLTECTKTPDDKDAERTRSRRVMARNPRYWLFNVSWNFVAAALVEEGIKYAATTHALGRWSVRSLGATDAMAGRSRDYILAGAAAGLGYGTFENLAFFVSQIVSMLRKSKRDGEDPHAVPFHVTVLERILVGIPGHAATATLIGAKMATAPLQLVAKSLSWSERFAQTWSILSQSVFFHATWNSVLLFLSAWDGHVGWVHPKVGRTLYTGLGILAVLQGSLYKIVWQRVGELWV
jgi:RsiW-degrading membrane proteinase PrsW (M82 family)